MALAEDKGPATSSYIGFMCITLSDMFGCSRAALIFALLLTEVITTTVMEITTTMTKAAARELVGIMHIHAAEAVLTTSGSLVLPIIRSPITVCRANMHVLPSVCTYISVQVTLVWLVVVGQLPQFDARML